jgi:hypothetical protein
MHNVEQTKARLERIERSMAAMRGFSGPACDDSACADPQADARAVADLMARSPQLALARAMRWPMIPIALNVIGTFPTTAAQTLVPSSFDTIPQSDCLVQSAVFRVVAKVTPAAGDEHAEMRDYFATLTNGIQATCVMRGSLSVPIAPNPTYVSALFDTVGARNSPAKPPPAWPTGLVIRERGNIEMQFSVGFPLQVAPLDAIVTFRAWQPSGAYFRKMLDSDALEALAALGYDTTNARANAGCR